MVEVLGCEKETSASSFPSQRCKVGLYTMPLVAAGMNQYDKQDRTVRHINLL